MEAAWLRKDGKRILLSSIIRYNPIYSNWNELWSIESVGSFVEISNFWFFSSPFLSSLLLAPETDRLVAIPKYTGHHRYLN